MTPQHENIQSGEEADWTAIEALVSSAPPASNHDCRRGSLLIGARKAGLLPAPARAVGLSCLTLIHDNPLTKRTIIKVNHDNPTAPAAWVFGAVDGFVMQREDLEETLDDVNSMMNFDG